MSTAMISRVKKVNGFLFLSGVTGEGNDTGEQARDIFRKIQKTLEENNSSLSNIISATVYLTDINDRPKYFNPVWVQKFPANPPTRTCVEIGLAPPAKVEVTVIAV
jgi:enamine deaminase RidA (YjgF/YER057c/UK114 family)